jgi:hypothetical protein
MLPALLTTLAFANTPALLRFSFDRPAILVVDGQDVEYGDTAGDTIVDGLAPGGHHVSVRNLANHEIWSGIVDTPAGSEVQCGWKRRKLDCATPPPPAAPAPASATLTVKALDAEWADVRVDGRVGIEVRNEHQGSMALSPGVHTVEIVDFMAPAPYASGRLEVGAGDAVELDLEQGRPAICDGSGWTSLSPQSSPSSSPL